MPPAVDLAREKLSDEVLPRLADVLAAAAATPVAAEASSRAKSTVAAAKGDLVLVEPKKRGRWLKRIAIVALVGGVVVVVARKLLGGGKESDWQAARPSTPYAPPKPAEGTRVPGRTRLTPRPQPRPR